MKRSLAVLIEVALAVAAAVAPLSYAATPAAVAISPPAREQEPVVIVSYRGAVARAAPSVVTVYTEHASAGLPGLRPKGPAKSLASGVIIDRDGYIVTNYQVVERTSSRWARAIEKLIYQQSGLLGVSGVSSDMRTLEASRGPDAKLAIDLFIYRIGREMGSLASALGGLEAIVFTAGIGENSRSLRERVCRDAAWLGVDLDATANQANAPRISTSGSRVAAWVIPTNEELMIARHTRALLSGATG